MRFFYRGLPAPALHSFSICDLRLFNSKRMFLLSRAGGNGRQHRRILIGQMVGTGAVALRLHTREIHPGDPHRGSSTVVFRGLLPR
jgi:hypothetical protein